MTISDVQQRILLTDIERPKEPLDVEILELTTTDLDGASGEHGNSLPFAQTRDRDDFRGFAWRAEFRI